MEEFPLNIEENLFGNVETILCSYISFDSILIKEYFIQLVPVLPYIFFIFALMDINFDPNSVIYLLILMRWRFALLIVIARNLVSNCLRH